MAELKFYSGNVLLKGKVLGALNGFDKSMRFSPAKAFDEDNLSYYEGPMDDSWVGLDLGAPYDITEIQFALRNDDNYIKPGDLYELFYHDNQGWVSLGKQEADTIYVKYKNVPENALLWLHNHSGGNEERIFTYEDNEALWW